MSLTEATILRSNAKMRANLPINGRVILDCQAKTINEWIDKDIASGQITQPTTVNNRYRLMRDVALWIPKPFIEYVDADYLDFFSNRCPPGSRSAYIMIVKAFERALHNLPVSRMGGKLPPCISWIGMTPQNKNTLTPDDLITEEEMLTLLRGAAPQMAAWVAVLWETGGRLSEVHRLKCSDVEVTPWGHRVTLKGKPRSKTKGGVRTNPMAKLSPYLTGWLNIHPFRNQNPDAPLWLNNIDRTGAGTSGNFPRKLSRLTRRLGIKKNITPHKFRHTKYTDMARLGTSEYIMRKHAGWSPTSNMPARYTHLANVQVETEALRVMGIDVPPETPMFSDINNVCPQCDMHNPIHVTYCVACSAPMDTLEYVEEAGVHFAEAVAKYNPSTNIPALMKGLLKDLKKKEKKG